MNKIKVVVRKISKEYIENNYDILVASLYRERKEAVRAFKVRDAAYTSIAAGRLLQDVAARELGILPEEIIIGRGEKGKPYIEGYESFKYNISHSGDYVALAYGKADVGIDIEGVRMLSEAADDDKKAYYDRSLSRDMRVAERFFCKSELSYIEESRQDWFENEGNKLLSDKSVGFTLTWTMKESFVKLLGSGISMPLNAFEIDYSQCKIKGQEAYFSYRQLSDYIICVCSREKSDIEFVYEENWVSCLYKDD